MVVGRDGEIESYQNISNFRGPETIKYLLTVSTTDFSSLKKNDKDYRQVDSKFYESLIIRINLK